MMKPRKLLRGVGMPLGLLFVMTLAVVAISCSDLSTIPKPTPTGHAQTQALNMREWYQCYSGDMADDWSCDDLGVMDGGDAIYIPGFEGPFQYTGWIQCEVTPSECPESATGSVGGDYGVPSAPASTSDQTPQPKPPSCSPMPTNADLRAWCEGRTPQTFETPRIEAALDSMRLEGDTCARLAAIGDTLLANNGIRFFDRNRDTTLTFAGAAPKGGATSAYGGAKGTYAYMSISVNFVDLYYDKNHTTTQWSAIDQENVTRDLQELLAHELDHLNGANHTDSDGFFTTNSQACSGLN